MKVGDLKNNKNIFSILILILLFYYSIIFVLSATFCIFYPYQVEYGEGFLLYQAKVISEGRNIYKDINEEPYNIVNYPPLYPLIISFYVQFFGTSFAFGRTISVFSVILLGFLIYKICRNIYVPFIFLSSPYIFFWSLLHRVDLLALLLSFLGIYFIKNNKIFASIPFFVLSFFTKQSFLAAPIATLLYLFTKKEKEKVKIALKFGLLNFGTIFALLFIINYITDGQFYLHTFVYSTGPYNYDRAVSNFLAFLQTHGFLIAISFWYLVSNPKNLFSIYFSLAIAISTITSGKLGSNVNYLIEPIAISCILFGLSMKDVPKDLTKILIVLQLLAFYHQPFHLNPSVDSLLSVEVQKHEKILSENAGILVINGKELYFQPLFDFTYLSNKGLWDQKLILSEIENKSFDLIILEFDVFDLAYTERLTYEMVLEIRENYCLSKKIGWYYLYEPCNFI